MNAEPVSTPGWAPGWTSEWTSEAIADLLDEFGLAHSWILLQIDLIAATRSMVTRVLIGRLATVQLGIGDLQDAAAQLSALPPTRLYEGLETLAARLHQARADEATPRPTLRLHDGGRR